MSGVSLSVLRGRVVGLLGPNGAGKTTCFRMMAGLLRPDTGRIALDGVDVTREPLHRRARRGLGYLQQEPSVFRGLSVEDNLYLVLEIARVAPAEARRRVERWLDDMNLAPVRRMPARTLSGGEKRRLEVARVLVLDPAVVLLDEPFTGVDPKGVEELESWIRRMASSGIGVVITDHNVTECLAICDEAHLIADGRIVASGPPDELARDPRARTIYFGDLGPRG